MPHVFISYSRADYHFAESLAFHLLQHDVPAWLDVKDLQPGAEWERQLMQAVDDSGVMLLVASPAAMKSPNVRQEWQRALERGKRVVVLAWFRRVALPQPLQHCERIDFRGRFGPALRRLLAALRSPAPGAAQRIGAVPRLPPGVAAMVAALALPIVGYTMAVAPTAGAGGEQFDELGLDATAQHGLIALLVFGLVWVLCLSFVQRRMGMTRLVACLVFVAAPFVYALGRYALGGTPALAVFDAAIARQVVEHWPIAAAFLAVPVLGLAVLLLGRAEDLLRWTPTGKVWARYRVGHAGQARAQLVDAREAFERAGRFRLVHDPDDAAMAARLREELTRAGSRESEEGAATTVLLLSNRSRLDWLQREADRPEAPRLTVVGSAIGLPESLAWLWKRQWIDFRRWDATRPDRERGLPLVPEAMHAARLPTPVAKLHRLLCAFGALVFVLGGALQPEQTAAPSDTVSAPEALGMLTSVAGWVVAWPARGLLRRRMAQATLRRWLLGLFAVCVVTGAGSAWLVFVMKGNWLPITLGVAGVLALPWWAWRQLGEVGFWLPQTNAGSQASARLTPAGDWRTLLAYVIFVFVWMAVLGVA